jgi:cytochrome P450
MTLDFKNSDFLASPYPYFEKLRKENPIYYDAEHKCWVVTSADIAKVVLGNESKFTISKKNIVKSDGEKKILDHQVRFFSFEIASHHLFLRKSFTSFFTPQAIQKIRPTAQQLAADLLENLKEDEVDLIESYFNPFVVGVAMNILGITKYEYQNIIQLADYVSHSLYFPGSEKDDSTWRFGLKQLKAFVVKTIEEQNFLEDGLLAHMVQLYQDKKIEHDELITNAVLFLTLTNDNSRHGMANVCWHLLHEQGVMHQFVDSETSIDAIDELLRIDAPMNVLQRFAVDDISIQNCAIQKGDKIVLLINAINCDETYFENPYTIDLNRSKINFSFGHGAHFCLGYHLGKMEADIALKALFKRYSNIKCNNEKPLWDLVLGLRKQKKLMVQLNAD